MSVQGGEEVGAWEEGRGGGTEDVMMQTEGCVAELCGETEVLLKSDTALSGDAIVGGFVGEGKRGSEEN